MDKQQRKVRRMDHHDRYKNIDIILATKHQKELAVSEPFRHAFGAKLFVPHDFDTDVFGTFTGEIARSSTPYETVIAKAKTAMKQYGYEYGIANEGSFGPHPGIFFLAGDVELMSFVDTKNDLVVVESEITPETNFAHLDVSLSDQYDNYLEKIKFGSHGLIIKNLADDSVIAKGITKRDELDAIIHSSLEKYAKIRLETDMRAMMNPTRMHVIHRLALKLVKRLQQICPACSSPGFGKLSVSGRLPCADCNSETEMYRSKILHCIKCEYHQTLPRDDGAVAADAQYCSFCNP